MKRWQLIQELFEATAGLDAPERERVLRERTGDDSELGREVEALVAADTTPAGELDRSATDLLLELRAEPPAADLVGLEFGAYRLDAHHSSGGMAHVYRATRTSAGTERRVALKVLRPGLDTDSLLQRFQRERETLAALEHDHIVAFLDAGALPDGRPFLVMEFVEGEPLSRWGRSASQRECIELFLQVLTAVQYAHRSLVVHRDLKPSNLLVTAQGVPKLLDFGVASVLEAEGEDTAVGVPMTPAYASPEQLRGEPVTTATDVYSLGVLLYELLSGELPESANSSGDLPADLAAIRCKACAPEPAQRYASVDRLADDLRRYLVHEPVAARPPSWIWRARLLLRRQRYALAVGAAVLVALVAGWIASDLARQRAERDASMGWGAHAQAKGASQVYEEWLTATVAGDAVLLTDAIEHLEQSLRRDLSEHPETETLLHLTLAELYLEREDGQGAAPHAERAWELAQKTVGIGRFDRARAGRLLERARPGR